MADVNRVAEDFGSKLESIRNSRLNQTNSDQWTMAMVGVPTSISKEGGPDQPNPDWIAMNQARIEGLTVTQFRVRQALIEKVVVALEEIDKRITQGEAEWKNK